METYYKINDDAIGAFRYVHPNFEFMMMNQTETWETRMLVEDFKDVLADEYCIGVPDDIYTWITEKTEFVIDNHTVSVVCKERKFKVSFPEMHMVGSTSGFMWSTFVKLAQQQKPEKVEEGVNKEIEKKNLMFEFKLWKKSHPMALTVSVPEKFRKLL